jgi:FKBP-type peptidyl-prolyl cis-trans isomerase
MRRGEKWEVVVPPSLAYGEQVVCVFACVYFRVYVRV